jgi:hypothetical protein
MAPFRQRDPDCDNSFIKADVLQAHLLLSAYDKSNNEENSNIKPVAGKRDLLESVDSKRKFEIGAK